MQMLIEGRRLAEIQEAVDAKYSGQQEDRTPTPLPPAEYIAPPYRSLES
jgi:hypothetical protein